MTPRMMHALRKRQLEHMQREELLVGMIASTTANFGFCRPENPISAEDFMLHPFKAKSNPQPKSLGDSIRSMVGSLPSRFVTKKEV
jgi:hypothetical protein